MSLVWGGERLVEMGGGGVNGWCVILSHLPQGRVHCYSVSPLSLGLCLAMRQEMHTFLSLICLSRHHPALAVLSENVSALYLSRWFQSHAIQLRLLQHCGGLSLQLNCGGQWRLFSIARLKMCLYAHVPNRFMSRRMSGEVSESLSHGFVLTYRATCTYCTCISQ